LGLGFRQLPRGTAGAGGVWRRRRGTTGGGTGGVSAVLLWQISGGLRKTARGGERAGERASGGEGERGRGRAGERASGGEGEGGLTLNPKPQAVRHEAPASRQGFSFGLGCRV